jgi:ABC-type glycerol-3-phosphate transport system substrate-binding protein
MKLSRLVALLAVLAIVPACGNSPTAPLAGPDALLQSELVGGSRIITTTTTTTSTTTSGGDTDGEAPKEGRGGGYLGSGN